MNTEDTHRPSYFIRNLSIVIGLVLIWRGVWHLLDILETTLGVDKTITAPLIGIIAGVMLLYAPDNDLKELQKL